jgi:hypothetical protein
MCAPASVEPSSALLPSGDGEVNGDNPGTTAGSPRPHDRSMRFFHAKLVVSMNVLSVDLLRWMKIINLLSVLSPSRV